MSYIQPPLSADARYNYILVELATFTVTIGITQAKVHRADRLAMNATQRNWFYI